MAVLQQPRLALSAPDEATDEATDKTTGKTTGKTTHSTKQQPLYRKGIPTKLRSIAPVSE